MDHCIDNILLGLNAKQRQAVEATEGPLLVIAGAGSGKTKTLTHRIAYILARQLAKEYEILAVTFTNKAAGEMRDRLAQLIGRPNERNFMPWMGTFHSIAVRILRRYGDSVGIPNNFIIFDEDDRLLTIRNILKDFAVSDREITPKHVAAIISNVKSEGGTVEEYAKKAHNRQALLIAEIFRQYEERRVKQFALDFDDLLLEALHLLKDCSTVRDELQQRFKYILIDEYQDTNHVQYQIVKLLLNQQRNICAVGDDWQSIYSWRGADFTNILNFSRDFKGAKVIKLEQNYRSTGNILNAAHNIIAKNVERSDKRLWTKAGAGEPVEFIEAYNELNEAEIVGYRIERLRGQGCCSYHDCAILYRTNAQSRALEQIFRKLALPYKIIGGLRFYDRAEVKDLIAYLRVVYQPHDEASFRRIVNVPKRRLGDTSVNKFLEWHNTGSHDLIESMCDVDACSALSPIARNQFSELGELFRVARELADNATPDRVLQYIVDQIHYAVYLDDGTQQAKSRIENVGELVSDAKQYGDLSTFLEEVALVSGADDANDDDAVTMMTMHAAKGLEFPIVYMVGMEDGLFPSARDVLSEQSMEEARRLCYVGMTRAKQLLTMSYAKSRMTHGRVEYHAPSEFLTDVGMSPAGNQLIDDMSYCDYRHYNRNTDWARPKIDPKNTEPYYEYDAVELAVGDTVSHQVFGRGTVLAINGSVVKVAFSDRERSINVDYAPLVKVT